MTWLTLKITGFPARQLMGTGTLVDSIRTKNAPSHSVSGSLAFWESMTFASACPWFVGANGIERYLHPDLSALEAAQFRAAAETVRKITAPLK
jgi:malate/lactate dehydrogenase